MRGRVVVETEAELRGWLEGQRDLRATGGGGAMRDGERRAAAVRDVRTRTATRAAAGRRGTT